MRPLNVIVHDSVVELWGETIAEAERLKTARDHPLSRTLRVIGHNPRLLLSAIKPWQ
jgi:hypothetical protein